MATIIFEAERLKYKNVGLYHFCMHLGNALIRQDLQQGDLDLYLYTTANGRIFDNNPRYIKTYPIHKFIQYFKVHPDVWHGSHQLTEYLPRNKSSKKIITIHDLNFLREKSVDKQKKYLNKVQSNLDRVDRIVCISHFVKKELQNYCDLKGKEVQVIYNGNNIHSHMVGVQPRRDTLNFEIPYIFTIGAVLRKKNFHILPYLLKGNSHNLIIAGDIVDRNYYNEIITIASNLGVEDRVFLIGAVSEAEKCYLLQHCALFCFPSLTEGFGLPVVEAMHYGKAILLSTATSLPEIGGDVVHYLDSFESDYLSALGSRIDSLSLSPSDKAKVQARAQLFNWDRAAKDYWTIYKELL